ARLVPPRLAWQVAPELEWELRQGVRQELNGAEVESKYYAWDGSWDSWVEGSGWVLLSALVTLRRGLDSLGVVPTQNEEARALLDGKPPRGVGSRPGRTARCRHGCIHEYARRRS